MMRCIVLVGLLCFFASCKKTQNETSTFLKTEQLQLAAPRVEMSNTIIDTSITLAAYFKMDGASIHYTTNGNDPSLQDPEYTSPLKITNPGSYKFASFHKDWLGSKSAFAKAYQKGYDPQKIVWKTTASDTYPSTSNQSLINHQKASHNFRDMQWTGFDTTAVATIFFKEKVMIEKITIGYLVDTKSWIFPPEKVSLIYNKTDTVTVHVATAEQETTALADIEIPVNQELYTIEVHVKNLSQIPDGHPGKGLNAWLFMDEWIFN